MSYYAVKEGVKPGIYNSWDKCKEMTSGYSGAVFKKFKTIQEAEAFINGAPINPSVTTIEIPTDVNRKLNFTNQEANTLEDTEYKSLDYIINSINKELIENLHTTEIFKNEEVAYAYVDGSYRSDRTVSYGTVILHNGETKMFSGRKTDKEIDVSSRNVVGELLGALRALKYCEDNNINNLILHFDYKGIGCWAITETTLQIAESITPWKAKTDLAKYYQKRMRGTSVNVIFKKVPAHTGVYYNEIADKLATNAK